MMALQELQTQVAVVEVVMVLELLPVVLVAQVL
jgi:hypothetical protein